MPPDIRELERHQHQTDKMARAVLKKIGKETGRGYAKSLADFRAGDYAVTFSFWTEIERQFPGQFNRVDYCAECKAFTLWHQAGAE